MEAGEGVSELVSAWPGGHPAEARAAPVDRAVLQDETGRRLWLRQRDGARRRQLLSRRHHHHVAPRVQRGHGTRRHHSLPRYLQAARTAATEAPAASAPQRAGASPARQRRLARRRCCEPEPVLRATPRAPPARIPRLPPHRRCTPRVGRTLPARPRAGRSASFAPRTCATQSFI